MLEWEKVGLGKVIYLTFDDGPHPIITPWVVEELNKVEAKATFFMVGENASKHKDIVLQLKASGNAIGNHTYNHLKGWNTDNETYLANIQKAAEFCENRLFRPPYGRIRRSQIALIQKAGYRIIMWSLLSCDYLKTLDKKESLAKLIKHSKTGSVVVFHDSIKAEDNLRWILPRYLKYLKDTGFTFAIL